MCAMVVALHYSGWRVPPAKQGAKPPKPFDATAFARAAPVTVCERVDAVATSDDELYERFVMQSTPLILTGAAEQLKRQAEKWSPQWLQRHWGAQEIHAQQAPDQWFNRVEHTTDGMVLRHPFITNMTFAEFVDRAVTGCCWAVAQFDMDGIENIVKLPGFTERMAREVVHMWVAQDQKVSSLHFDEYDGVLIQAAGTKIIKLIDPQYMQSVYPTRLPVDLLQPHTNGTWGRRRCPCPNFNLPDSFNFSPVNLTAPDMQNFPKFGDVPIIECRLDPGEILLLPATGGTKSRTLSTAGMH